jgi:hypothetical protein
MLLGRSLVHWLVVIFVAICLFILARWAIPLLFGLVGIVIPPEIVLILALLIAVGWGWGGYSWRSGPGPVV